MTIFKPTGYQKRVMLAFCEAFKKATGEDYGISWGLDNKGILSLWERGYGSVMGIKRYGGEPTAEEIEAIFKLIERKFQIAIELYEKDARWNPFPASPMAFAIKFPSYLESKSTRPLVSKPTQSAEELRKELEN